MLAAERRRKFLEILSKRRFETISNLAYELEVSERTIRRDISILSETEPVYTRSGRYGGGVYILDGYYSNKFYFSKEESDSLKAILFYIDNNLSGNISNENIENLKRIIVRYTKPTKV